MSKKLLIAIAIVSFALLGTTFAEVENIKVSGDIATGMISRDLSLEATPSNDGEDFLFSQIRLRFDADLTENVSAVLGLINERIWGDEDNTTAETAQGEDSDIALDLAYVELKEFLYQPLTLTVGRQNLRYGNALIIGDPDTNQAASGEVPGVIGDLSLRKSFDAARAVLDYSPYTIDLIYAIVDEGATSIDDDVALWGGNIAYQWGSYNGITEGYFFGSETRSGANNPIVDGEAEDKTFVVGARIQMDPSEKTTVGLEYAYQFGDAAYDNNNAPAADDATDHLSAFAIQASGEYRFLNDYNARIGLGYTYLSGEDDFADDDYEGWDPMFEDQNPSEILNILAANTNCQLIRLSGSLMPREDVTLGLVYARAMLAEKMGDGVTAYNTYNSAVGPAAAVNTYAVDRRDRHFGDEIDTYVIYDYTEDVQLKLISAIFLPGNFFSENNDATAYSVRGGLSVNF